MRDAVDDQSVAARGCHFYGAKLDKFSRNSGRLHRIDPVDEGPTKSVLHSKEDADLLHQRSELLQKFNGHLMPPRPIMPRSIPPHIQTMRDSLFVHDVGEPEVLIEANVPLSSDQNKFSKGAKAVPIP